MVQPGEGLVYVLCLFVEVVLDVVEDLVADIFVRGQGSVGDPGGIGEAGGIGDPGGISGPIGIGDLCGKGRCGGQGGGQSRTSGGQDEKVLSQAEWILLL